MDKKLIQPETNNIDAQLSKQVWSKPVLMKLDLKDALAAGGRPNNDGTYPFS